MYRKIPIRPVLRSLSPLAVVAAAGLAVFAPGAFAASGASGAQSSSTSPPVAIYLVRHGETVGEGPGRRLSPVGQERAEALAARLADAGIERIYTTDFLRTRETAAPTAERLGLDPEVYDAADLPGFARELRRRGETALVVGHSDTTPELVRLLGGDPGPPIAHDEHDRLYRVELPTGRTELTRFGPGS